MTYNPNENLQSVNGLPENPPDGLFEPGFSPKSSSPKKSIWIWALLGLLVAAIVCGLVYYFFFYKQSNNTPITVNNTEKSLNAQNSSPQENVVAENPEIAGWKTYTNNEYGFEVKYPGDYFSSIDTTQKVINDEAYGSVTSLLGFQKYGEVTSENSIDTLIMGSITFSSLNYSMHRQKGIDYANSNPKYNVSLSTPTEMLLGNKQAYSQNGSIIVPSFTECQITRIDVPINSGTISFGFVKCGKGSLDSTAKEKMVIDGMLSTAKFTK